MQEPVIAPSWRPAEGPDGLPLYIEGAGAARSRLVQVVASGSLTQFTGLSAGLVDNMLSPVSGAALMSPVSNQQMIT